MSHHDIVLQRDANGAYWDTAERALYLTEGNTLVRWSAGSGFSQIAEVGSAGVELGGLVRLPDGSFAITSFGFGSDGGVFVVGASHPATAVPDLDKRRRRIGIARDADGKLYDAYFVVDGKVHTGGVAALDLASGETDVVTGGLAKPVGIAVVRGELFVSDQDGSAIDAVGSGALAAVATGLPGVDLLCALPDGSLVTGGKAGTVTEVTRGGTRRQLASGLGQVRGMAYDPVEKTLYVVEHGKTSHVLHTLSLADLK